MIKYFPKLISLFAFTALLITTGCRKKDAPLPDNILTFETSSVGIAAGETNTLVKLKLTRATDRDIAVTVKVTNQMAVYTQDYATLPVVTAGGDILLTIPSGNNETSFTINKTAGTLFDGDEKVVFDIYSSAAPVIIGVQKQLTLSFGELVATTSAMVVNGGGPTYPNKVFLDLSANRQTQVARTSYDLGFYNGSDDFRAVLNSSVNMMVKQTTKSEMKDVSSADTVGLTNEVSFSQTTPSVGQMAYIDHPSGDLTRTAIAQIGANAADNKVYIVNRGTGIGSPGAPRGWKKIRIIRNASGGYTLQHANLDDVSFTSIDIAKDNNYFFKHVSFETGAVVVEPVKAKWDIAWTYFANATNFGGGDVPYLFQDIILLNREVEVAKVMTATKGFEAFAESDIALQTFLKTQNAIASDWRSGGGPGVSPAVRTDRYYIIKDAANHYYKLRFTALTNNGERGYPAFEAVFIK